MIPEGYVRARINTHLKAGTLIHVPRCVPWTSTCPRDSEGKTKQKVNKKLTMSSKEDNPNVGWSTGRTWRMVRKDYVYYLP